MTLQYIYILYHKLNHLGLRLIHVYISPLIYVLEGKYLINTMIKTCLGLRYTVFLLTMHTRLRLMIITASVYKSNKTSIDANICTQHAEH